MAFFPSVATHFIADATSQRSAIGNHKAVPPTSGVRNHRQAQIRSVIEQRGLLYPLDVLLVGATGSGKSSTLNAIFGDQVSKVGDGVDPETQSISEHMVHDYLRVHDSAGLGDGVETDAKHAESITKSLLARCAKPYGSYGLMDLALVILDGGSRDLGTAFCLLETIVLKAITPDRVIVAINQADMAMKGRKWNHARSCPESELVDFLAEKSSSVQRRIKDSTGLHIKQPICYSARYNWNLDLLVDHIVDHIPNSRRILATGSV